MSFSAGTRVLLASGASIPISKLRPGDKVLATNVKTGKTQAESVSAVFVHHDIDRYDLRVRTVRGTVVIHTTANHLFFSQTTRSWTKATALGDGTRLRDSAGASVTVLVGYLPATRDGWMWDLSVPGGHDHDFYVVAGASSVLVHNCDDRAPWRLTRQGASRVMRGGPFNTTFYQSASDGNWWTVDEAGHGQVASAFKVYEDSSAGLSWITNANEYGDYIEGMWKGPVGRFIPWSQLHG